MTPACALEPEAFPASGSSGRSPKLAAAARFPTALVNATACACRRRSSSRPTLPNSEEAPQAVSQDCRVTASRSWFLPFCDTRPQLGATKHKETAFDLNRLIFGPQSLRPRPRRRAARASHPSLGLSSCRTSSPQPTAAPSGRAMSIIYRMAANIASTLRRSRHRQAGHRPRQ